MLGILLAHLLCILLAHLLCILPLQMQAFIVFLSLLCVGECLYECSNAFLGQGVCVSSLRNDCLSKGLQGYTVA